MDPLSVKIHLLACDEVPEEVSSRMKPGDGGIIRMNGWIWIRSGDNVIAWADNEAGKALLEMAAKRGSDSAGRKDPWQILLDGGTPTEILPEMRNSISRCVILFEADPVQGKLLEPDVMADLAPMERGDILRPVSAGKIALIKAVSDHSDEEIREYAAAVIETVETEAGIPVQAGIGQTVSALSGLKDSFSQAKQALDIGRRFQLEGSVFEYGRQIMERLISAVPERERNLIRREVFTPETEKLMNGEMMETVQVFFNNDLNLSTAARQLFIHRNTLIYRLDKIRKQTGFDLRKFQDAAAFRLLCRLPADCEETPKREK